MSVVLLCGELHYWYVVQWGVVAHSVWAAAEGSMLCGRVSVRDVKLEAGLWMLAAASACWTDFLR